jgi:hypothetical protein
MQVGQVGFELCHVAPAGQQPDIEMLPIVIYTDRIVIYTDRVNKIDWFSWNLPWLVRFPLLLNMVFIIA